MSRLRLREIPGRLKGLVLFHSHCFADSAQEKKNRTRTVEVVRADHFGFLPVHTRPVPGRPGLEFRKEIDALVNRAKEISKKGIIAAIKGMRERKDQSEMLKIHEAPVLFILGMKNPKAPVFKVLGNDLTSGISESLILRDCGHMGYIEAPEITLKAVGILQAKVF